MRNYIGKTMTIEEFIKMLTTILYRWLETDRRMHEIGIIYKEKAYQEKLRYKLKNHFRHLPKIVEEVSQEELLKKIKIENVLLLKKYKEKVSHDPVELEKCTLEGHMWGALYGSMLGCSNYFVRVVKEAIKEKKKLDVEEIESFYVQGWCDERERTHRQKMFELFEERRKRMYKYKGLTPRLKKKKKEKFFREELIKDELDQIIYCNEVMSIK